MAQQGRPDLRKLVFPHEFDRTRLVMQNDDVKIIAARVRQPRMIRVQRPIQHLAQPSKFKNDTDLSPVAAIGVRCGTMCAARVALHCRP